MRVIERWPSLANQIEVAGRVFGISGVRRVEQWLDEQIGFVGDADFARTFSDHAQLPGILPLDYSHRHLRTTRGNVLGGIRFYSRDIARPFVDVLAHSFDDVDALAECVAAEWSAFNVRFLRLRTKPRLLAHRPDVILDKSVHLARCRDMAPADGRVSLERFPTVEPALRLVAERHTQVGQTNPPLGRNLSPAAPEDLQHWHEHGQLWAVRVGDSTVGVFAAAPGAIGWISGQEINEEVINAAHAGKRYAASAQCAWAHSRIANPTNLLIGTIDRHNHASRATAVRAGRPAVLDDIFIACKLTN